MVPKLQAACAWHAKTFGGDSDEGEDGAAVNGGTAENPTDLATNALSSPSSSASSSSSIYSHEPALVSILPSFLSHDPQPSPLPSPPAAPAIESPFRCLPHSVSALMREAAAAEYVLFQVSTVRQVMISFNIIAQNTKSEMWIVHRASVDFTFAKPAVSLFFH